MLGLSLSLSPKVIFPAFESLWDFFQLLPVSQWLEILNTELKVIAQSFTCELLPPCFVTHVCTCAAFITMQVHILLQSDLLSTIP